MVETIGMATCSSQKKKKKKKINRLRFYPHKLIGLIQQSKLILPAIISL